jgi:hypothetical protein
MKKLILATSFALSGIAAPLAHAQSTAAGSFDVNIALTSKCEINSTTAGTAVVGNLAMSYTSFQTTNATGNTNFNVRCTETLPFSLSLDAASVTDGATGLDYTLALSASAVHTAGPFATLGGQAGTGANVQYYVHGTIASGLAGTSTAGTANNARTLTVTY